VRMTNLPNNPLCGWSISVPMEIFLKGPSHLCWWSSSSKFIASPQKNSLCWWQISATILCADGRYITAMTVLMAYHPSNPVLRPIRLLIHCFGHQSPPTVRC
jgi:hypothetical protein